MVEAHMINMEERFPRVTAAQFAAKFRSKKEVYNFLTVDAGAYLCDSSCLTIYFLKDLATGARKFLRENQVKHISCPQYKGLTIEEMFEMIKQYPEVATYLPEERDLGRLPRQWIANVSFAIIGDDFSKWVKEKVEERHSKMIDKRNLAIDLDPQIAQAFYNSNAISTSKGTGAHMLKAGSKRRRTKEQIRGQRTFEEVANCQIAEQAQEIDNLKDQLIQVQAEAQNNKAASQILTQMIERGEAEVGSDGSINVSKAKGPNPNYIGNSHDF